MISQWFQSTIQQCCEFPFPSSLILKQSPEFPPTQRQRTHSTPLYSLTSPSFRPRIEPWGKLMTCALWPDNVQASLCSLVWVVHHSVSLTWCSWRRTLFQVWARDIWASCSTKTSCHICQHIQTGFPSYPASGTTGFPYGCPPSSACISNSSRTSPVCHAP